MGIHDGHRQRMKKRFLEHGLDNFDDVNVLELLLFYAQPRQDTNELAHALMDAMLGACAMGDIGHLFPDNDDRFLGADSMKLLEEVTRVTAEKGWQLGNCDVTVICQKAKLAPYIDEMRENLADVIGVEPCQISVKATTTEKLGFTGRGEGIAAEAVCIMTRI